MVTCAGRGGGEVSRLEAIPLHASWRSRAIQVSSAQHHRLAALFVISHRVMVARANAGVGHLLPAFAVPFPGITSTLFLGIDSHPTKQDDSFSPRVIDSATQFTSRW